MAEFINTNDKNALLIGVGGIGKNVYWPQLVQHGYNVTTVDNVNKADFTSIDDVTGVFDVAIICVPNYLHSFFADKIASFCKTVLIEKPGLPSADQWNALCDKHPDTRFIMCKNNLYRDSYGCFDNLENIQDPVSIKIKWFNKNRVPNPGYWSTNRKTAWGGVALDLFPHLYCHMVRLFGSMEDFERANHLMMQKWSLEDLQGSDYGAVSEDGVYNVCDFATENWLVQGKTLLEVSASWKEGYDNQSIEVQTIDSTFKWDFGLCPNDAYGKMIVAAETEDYDKHKAMDTWIHKNLEVYHEG